MPRRPDAAAAGRTWRPEKDARLPGSLQPGGGLFADQEAWEVRVQELMPLILAALGRNQRVRLTVTGGSMFPFVLSGDVVELEPLSGLPTVGDIVLARLSGEPGGPRYVVHRVIRREGEAFFVRGDAQPQAQGPCRRPDLLGKVTHLHRQGRVFRIDQGLWRLLGLAWNRSAPLNVWIFQLFSRLKGKRP